MLRAEFLPVCLPLSPLALIHSLMYLSVRRPQLGAARKGMCSHFLWPWGHEYCKAWETAAKPGGLSVLISLCNTMPNSIGLLVSGADKSQDAGLVQAAWKTPWPWHSIGPRREVDGNTVPCFFSLARARGTSVVHLPLHGLRSAVQLLEIISL